MDIATILKHGLVITDGAWGTQLQARGLPAGACPDAWNLMHPDLVAEVPRAYVEAGSQIVLTNTFRSNRLALGDHGVTESVAEINRAGVEISRRAAEGRAWVFASMGPSGKMLLAGDVSEDELKSVFLEQAEALAAGGADAIVVETMADLDEARLAVEAAWSTGLPVVACMVFDSGANRDRTMMGATPEQAAAALVAAGADVIGANCGQGIEGYLAIGRRLRAACDRPIWIKANAGIPQLVADQVVYPSNPQEFAVCAKQLAEAGISFIGGCCGTSPEFIRALRERLA